MTTTYLVGRHYRLARVARLFYAVRNDASAMLLNSVELPVGSEIVVQAPKGEPSLDRDGQPRPEAPVFQSADGRVGYLDPSARGWPLEGLLELLPEA